MLYEIEHSEDSQIVNELAKTIFLGLGLRGVVALM
jgi:hypothetical protein